MFVFHRIDDVYAQRHDLMRILALFERLDIPAILGVIPARLTAEMDAYLAVRPLFTVFQHGVAHKNYASKWPPPNRSPVGIVYHIKDLSEADVVEIESVIRWSARHAPMPRPWSQFVGAA